MYVKNENEKVIYCYDFNLSKEYIKAGESPVMIGVGYKNTAYLAFVLNSNIDRIFKSWKGKTKRA